MFGMAQARRRMHERWMTMTTCHPEYGNWQRYIVHLKFESWTPKDTGVPAELVDEPTN